MPTKDPPSYGAARNTREAANGHDKVSDGNLFQVTTTAAGRLLLAGVDIGSICLSVCLSRACVSKMASIDLGDRDYMYARMDLGHLL